MRWLAEAFGQRLGKTPVFTGVEAADGWLVNTAAGDAAVRLSERAAGAARSTGPPTGSARGMPSLGKDTHYDTRDGNF